ncbi:hypothetical protein [Burkholderia pseudomallei]|uniref:hypothetical protein n=3 Tax=Burkholderia pseudomallei TaxID=28450 RepID=UPI000F1564B6|nr:Uncharacterised protein [Burkholderia pseudomallei]VCN48177.1 Uncharacterised protein [Burkholderia pseudomallei]
MSEFTDSAAGRSTTSPAAIWLINWSGSGWIARSGREAGDGASAGGVLERPAAESVNSDMTGIIARPRGVAWRVPRSVRDVARRPNFTVA